MGPNKKVIVHANNAPKALGPYSAGVKAGGWVYTAGQIGIERETGNIISGGIEAETRQVLNNIQNILSSAGSSLDCVVKTTVYLKDIDEFDCMNNVYAEFFSEDPPARSVVQISALPKGALIEIEAVAICEH
jgi:2-iminobutanoate/2-iminopropanoate deaminase